MTDGDPRPYLTAAAADLEAMVAAIDRGARRRAEAIRMHLLCRRHALTPELHPDRWWYHARIARELREQGPMSVGALADNLGLSQHEMAYRCGQMISWGELEQVPGDNALTPWMRLRGHRPGIERTSS